MTGSTRDAAPIGRRITTPHAPPDSWCTMPSARQPSVTPRHSMYAIRYDWKNCVGFMNQPDERHHRAGGAGDQQQRR